MVLNLWLFVPVADNILYTKEKIIKIADFGLSFDMNVNKGR